MSNPPITNALISDLKIAFAERARQWLGVPYQHRGTTRQGCDCTGLLIGIAQELGYLEGYVLRQYPIDWNLHAGAGNQVLDELSRFGQIIPNAQAGLADIAVIYFGRCPAHCGLIVDAEKLLMVHCYRRAAKVGYGILRNSMWSRRWIHTVRLNESELQR